MSDLKPYLALVAKGETLSQEEAEAAFALIMEGKASEAQIGAFLMGLRLRGESVEEITGAARILRERAETIEAPDDAIDTCGTGGDAKGSFNISTASALVTASCGVPVAKHGNRAQTSKSGSSDVLAALGVNIEAEPALLQLALKQANICFLMAPRHHAAMRCWWGSSTRHGSSRWLMCWAGWAWSGPGWCMAATAWMKSPPPVPAMWPS